MVKIIKLFLILVLFLAITFTASAEEKVNLSDKEQAAVQNFAAALLENPVDIVLTAQLLPPKTKYEAKLNEQDLNNLKDRVSELIDFPKSISGDKEYKEAVSNQKFFAYFTKSLKDEKWTPQIPCGTWQLDYNEDENEKSIFSEPIALWYHPNEGAKKCPHKEGTDHPGTISTTGTYTLRLDYESNLKTTTILTGKWMFECTYKDGSKSGSVPCEVKLVSWEGQYGKMAPPVSSQQDRKNKSSQQVALAAAGLAALIAGGFYLFRRFH